MTLKQLEYFLAIAEAGHITAAAKNLNISQPPLSLQLKALEDELGVQLFERDKRNLTITHEGLILKERAIEILAMVNNTVRELQNLGTDAQGTIHIGTISSACSHLLPERIVSFRSDHPNVDFQIFEGNSTTVLEMLEQNAVELGIVREPFNTSIYNSVPLRDESLGKDESDFFVAVALPSFFENFPGEEIPLVDLKGMPLIVHRRYNDMLTNYCRQRGFSPNIICQNSEIASSLSWAEAGIGVAIVANNASLKANKKLVVRRIVNPTIASRAYLVWDKSQNISHLAKQFIDLFDSGK